MNTAQMAYRLEHYPKTSKKFCGVFSSDKLPQTIDKYPCGLVVNTDASTKPGTHWIAVFLASPLNGDWFDSYGKPPGFYGPAFAEFMNKHCDEWKFNDRKLQSDWSDVRGHHCIFYLGHRARGYKQDSTII